MVSQWICDGILVCVISTIEVVTLGLYTLIPVILPFLEALIEVCWR
jgi:hypothetical protein